MGRSFLECRLVHKDYDMNLNGKERKIKEEESKNELLANFIKGFNLQNAIIKDDRIVADNGNWYFSVATPKGSTMIFIAKWPVGLSAYENTALPPFQKEIINQNCNESEKAWYATHSDPLQFLLLIVSRESFHKCYYAEYGQAPDFKDWKLIEIHNNLAYTNGKDTYECKKGIGGNTYTFTVCDKQE